MAKCIKCNVTILDDTKICPLCQQILEPIPGEHTKNVYPDIEEKKKKISAVIRIVIFLACVAEALFVFLNLKNNPDIYWSLITACAFVYTILTLRFSTDPIFSLKIKLVVQTLWGVLFVIGIDAIYGFQGWSVNYVLPGAIVTCDIITLILMIINKRYYQEYMVLELLLMAISVIPIVLYYFGMAHSLTISLTGLIASAILFLGTLAFGGSRSSQELSRRFHVN